MIMATYSDFFNVNNSFKSPINRNKKSKNLKNQILKSVKTVIEDDKRNRPIKEKK